MYVMENSNMYIYPQKKLNKIIRKSHVNLLLTEEDGLTAL